jgi:hypothetical protein
MLRFGLLLFIGLLTVPVSAQEADHKNRIVLTPVSSLTDNKEFLYLKGTIYNVLLINLQKQERLAILNEEPGAAYIINTEGETEAYLATLARSFPGAVAIVGEYYVDGDACHILVNVWDLDTLRIKNSFIETLPADLDLLPNIEKLSSRIAISVARELPPTERDALFQKQVVASLRKKINQEEQLTREIFTFHHALAVAPFTGLGTGRSVVSWNTGGPLISPVLSLDYTYFFENAMHLRFRAEYLGLANLYAARGVQQEISLEALVGIHTISSFSFALEAGLAVTYDWNTESAALASSTPVDPTPRSIERVTLTLPLVFGFTLSLTPRFFINLSLTYNGLSYTFEPLPPSDYDSGFLHLRYASGFSPWNFINISILLKAGVRF